MIKAPDFLKSIENLLLWVFPNLLTLLCTVQEKINNRVSLIVSFVQKYLDWSDIWIFL